MTWSALSEVIRVPPEPSDEAERARSRVEFGTDARLGDRFSHAAMAVLVLIMVSNSIGVKRPKAA